MQTLILDCQRRKMLENGSMYRTFPDFDPFPVVKLFTPWGGATWLLTDLDPDDEEVASGLCDLGMGCPELGSVSLREIRRLRGPAGLGVERDIWFSADKPISQYAEEARRAQAIRA